MPSFGGKAVDNRDAAMQAMWLDPRPAIFADIKQDNRITMRLGQRLSGARTKSRFAWALRTGRGSYGLICADWTEHFAPWESGLYDCFEQTVTDVLNPIIAVAKGIADQDPNGKGRGSYPYASSVGLSGTASMAALTGSEIEVARLVAKGLSYKEIARIRGRSFLPPYSPDLNPIEKLFAKLKHCMRRAAKRSIQAVHDAIAHTLDDVTPNECNNYIESAGYKST